MVTLELPWSYPGATLELPCSETETSDGAPHEPTARPGAALRRSPRRDAPDDAALAAVGRLVPTPARRYRVGRRVGYRVFRGESEAGLYGRLTRNYFFPYKSFFGNSVRGTEAADPGSRPDRGRRVREGERSAAGGAWCTLRRPPGAPPRPPRGPGKGPAGGYRVASEENGEIAG